MLRPDHEIFRKPFPVAFRTEDTPTPKNFKEWKPTVGDTVPTFRVFDTFDEKKDEWGLVTDDSGFEETPDAERILGGINHKGPDYAAIARHGSFVMFGFHARPERLTDEGRRLYLNTLAYAVAHKGTIVETLRLRPRRTDLLDMLTIFAHMYPADRRAAAVARHYAGEQIAPALLEDAAAAREWYTARAPFLHPLDDGSNWDTQLQLTVDPECKELGVANDSPAFLDALAARLAANVEDRLARTLLARYVRDVAPADFGAWVARNRESLYFTEAGGWVWRVRGTRATSPSLRNVGAAKHDDPVRVAVEATDTTLTISLQIREGWHVYSPKSKDGQPVRISILAGSAFEAAGDVDWGDDGDGTLRDWVEIKVPMRRVAAGDVLRVQVSYVVCDERTCRPRAAVMLER